MFGHLGIPTYPGFVGSERTAPWRPADVLLAPLFSAERSRLGDRIYASINVSKYYAVFQ